MPQNGWLLKADSLTINQVNGIVVNNSNVVMNPSLTKYQVPVYNKTSPLFASSIWLGGYSSGKLHVTAMTYQQNGRAYWAGPLDTVTLASDTVWALPFSGLWKVNRFDIANFIYNWNAGNVQNGTFFPASEILNWPAHGTGNYSRRLAPFFDNNGDGVYNPINDGDYPLIKGDQMIWWVFNDTAGRINYTSAGAFGVEVHASAYAFVCPNIADSNRVLNYTTFYNYKIINRSTRNYDSCKIGIWVDPDLGFYSDDYIGCDVENNFGYAYNGDNYDEDLGIYPGYHSAMPAFSCPVLNGPQMSIADGIDNNNNGVIDEPAEKALMNTFGYFTNTGDAQTGNPSVSSPAQYYNYLSGRWKNNTYLTYGGAGISPVGSSSPVCRHLFPGTSDSLGVSMGGSLLNPVPAPAPYNTNPNGWTEGTGGVLKNDMRFLMGAGPGTMISKGTYEIDFAFVFSQDTANCVGNATCILPRMKEDNKRVRNWFNSNSFPTCLNMAGIGIGEEEKENGKPHIFPNPAASGFFVEFSQPCQNVTIEMTDVIGNVVKGAYYPFVNKYIEIPIGDLASGPYMVRIKNKGLLTYHKLIKE